MLTKYVVMHNDGRQDEIIFPRRVQSGDAWYFDTREECIEPMAKYFEASKQWLGSGEYLWIREIFIPEPN